MQIDGMIEALLNEPVVNDDNTITFTSRAIQMIHDTAELCQTIPIVEKTKEQSEEYAKDLSAEQVYVDMLHKIVAAPTRLQMRADVRMLIPVIDRKLKGCGEGE